MLLHFTKMQACGNDYIYINCFAPGVDIADPSALAVTLNHRRFGVGGDGLVLMLPSQVADAKMRIFNADGSEAKMCGNAIRCVGKYLYENEIVPKKHMRIESLSGIKKLTLTAQHGRIVSVAVDMGAPILTPRDVPVQADGDAVIARDVTIGGRAYQITCVSMGNPHAVVFCENPDPWDLAEIGPAFEHNPLFPDRVNLELVQVITANHLKMRVWERGSGETFACGTGACAAAVAAVLNGYCQKNTDITVAMPGGALVINYTDEAVYMTGDCQKTFDGVVEA